MNKRTTPQLSLFVFTTLFLCLSSVALCQAESEFNLRLTPDQLKDGIADHPRLILTNNRLAELKTKIEKYDWAKRMEKEIRAQTEEFSGKRRLPKNAPAWKIWNTRARHITNAALLYRIHGDAKWLDLAISEMRVFLDEPEYQKKADEGRGAGLPASSGVLGLALGYDWLYHDLTPEFRKEVEDFLLKNSFPTLYQDGTLRSFPDSNWRQVILGAHAIAALAIADQHPERAAQVLSDTVPQVAGVVSHYRPDGICPEGVHYWDFGMEFTAALYDSLDTSLGTTFGLNEWPVLDATVRWRTAANSAVDGNFPYADGSRFNLSVLFMSYWARQTKLDWLVQREDLFHLIEDDFHRHADSKAWMALPLIWLPGDAIDGTPPEDLLTFIGVAETEGASRSEWQDPPYAGPKVPGIVNLIYRSAWKNPDALWLGAVGGRANVSHGHMHGGSIVLDAGGTRWVDEVKTHHYDAFRDKGIRLWSFGTRDNRPGRESVYAWGNKGHNTLMIDDDYHDPDGAALLVGKPNSFPVSIDLTAVLGPKVKTAIRSYRILPDDLGIELSDSWTAAEHGFTMKSRFHTEANVTTDGQTVTLERNGRKMRIEVNGPPGTKIVAGPMSQFISKLDRPLDGVTVIDIQVETPSGESKQLTTRFELLTSE